MGCYEATALARLIGRVEVPRMKRTDQASRERPAVERQAPGAPGTPDRSPASIGANCDGSRSGRWPVAKKLPPLATGVTLPVERVFTHHYCKGATMTDRSDRSSSAAQGGETTSQPVSETPTPPMPSRVQDSQPVSETPTPPMPSDIVRGQPASVSPTPPVPEPPPPSAPASSEA